MRTSAVIPTVLKRTVLIETEIVIIECANCSVDFGIGKKFQKRRREDHDSFFCPNGHSNFYPQENAEEKLRKQLEQQKKHTEYARSAQLAAQDQAEHERRSKAAYKGVLTKIKKRIANGLCPCCNRHFENVMLHMKGQHPDFLEQHDLG